MTKELFGTDGIRGIPGTYPLDDATLYGVARALGKYLLESDPQPRVLLGMDTRESGPHIASQLAAGLADDGVAVLSAGVITHAGGRVPGAAKEIFRGHGDFRVAQSFS